jgi:hypothetical protein
VLRYIANGASNQRMLKAIAEQPDRLIKEMDRAIGRIIQEMAVTAKIKAPKAMSTLTNSIIPEQLSRFEGVVRANVSYAEAVEKGTGIYGPLKRSHGMLPPIRSLIDWIKVKGIEPRDPDMDQEDVAWAIARKISWTGTKPQPFFEPTLEEKSAWADKRIEQAIDNALGLA